MVGKPKGIAQPKHRPHVTVRILPCDMGGSLSLSCRWEWKDDTHTTISGTGGISPSLARRSNVLSLPSSTSKTHKKGLKRKFPHKSLLVFSPWISSLWGWRFPIKDVTNLGRKLLTGGLTPHWEPRPPALLWDPARYGLHKTAAFPRERDHRSCSGKMPTF